MTYLFRYSLILGSALLLALALTPLGNWLGHRWHIVSRPGGRRRHRGTVSRLGGLGLAGGFFVALFLSRVWAIPTLDPQEMRRFWGLVVGAALMWLFGLLDDRYELPPGVEYLGYLLAAGVAILGVIILERFNNPFTGQTVVLPALLYIPLTLFWMTGMIVTVNWLDGLDGLAAGVAAILSLVLAAHMHRSGQYSVVPQVLALFGASLGFLVYNLSPLHAHLGSNGAFFLGYTLGALGLIAGGRVATVLLAMGIPIVDVALTILARWRQGVSPFRGDRQHLHYRLQDAGVPPRTIVLFYWGFCALVGTLALLLSSRLYKLLALLLVGGLTLALRLYVSEKREG